MNSLIKKVVHVCLKTDMVYPYPSRICPWCKGKGIDLQMTTKEMYKENVRRQFEKKLSGGL